MNDNSKSSLVKTLLKTFVVLLAIAVLFYVGFMVGRGAKQAQQPESQSYLMPTVFESVKAQSL